MLRFQPESVWSGDCADRKCHKTCAQSAGDGKSQTAHNPPEYVGKSPCRDGGQGILFAEGGKFWGSLGGDEMELYAWSGIWAQDTPDVLLGIGLEGCGRGEREVARMLEGAELGVLVRGRLCFHQDVVVCARGL